MGKCSVIGVPAQVLDPKTTGVPTEELLKHFTQCKDKVMCTLVGGGYMRPASWYVFTSIGQTSCCGSITVVNANLYDTSWVRMAHMIAMGHWSCFHIFMDNRERKDLYSYSGTQFRPVNNMVNTFNIVAAESGFGCIADLHSLSDYEHLIHLDITAPKVFIDMFKYNRSRTF